MFDLDVVQWAQSPLGFYTDRRWVAGRWVAETGPICLAPHHADILRHVLTPDGDGRLPYDLISWCEPAKSGKSAIAGLVAQYVGLHGDRNSAVILASNKKDQAASLMYASFAESLRANPFLHAVPGRYETLLPSGTVVKAIASNSRGEAGARFTAAIFDELWAYDREDCARLWAEHKIDPTRTSSIKLAVGYAGYIGESELWLDLLTRGLAGEPVPDLAHITNGADPACWRNGRLFAFWSHACRQPWQTEAWVESQRQALRAAEFQRMIRCEFVEGAGDFIDPEVWASLVDPALLPLQPGTGDPVYVGLDLALSPGGDDCAAVAVFPSEGVVKVALHRVWRGKDRDRPLRLGETVKPWLQAVAAGYNLAGVYFDPWQAQHLADELRDLGMPCFAVPQTHGSRGPKDTKLWELASTGRLKLYNHADLRTAAAGASAKELGNGLLFLQKASGRAKIDLLVALSNCASEADKTADWLIY